MDNENKTIQEKAFQDFDLNLICEYFSNVERQGPGSPEMTLRALSFIDNLNENSQIADIGCGTGGQTMVLAQNAPGNIVGLDFFPKFIEIVAPTIHQSEIVICNPSLNPVAIRQGFYVVFHPLPIWNISFI